jgi:type II secretory pathway pseudopilin PulG
MASPIPGCSGQAMRAGRRLGAAEPCDGRHRDGAPRLHPRGAAGYLLKSAPAARRLRGYTYVGLLILLAIIGLASALTVTAGSRMQQRSNEEELIFIGTEFARAFQSYFEATPAGQSPYPARLEDLLRDPRYVEVRRHLRKLYFDPMTGKQEWANVASPDERIMGVHSRSEKAPLKISGFPPSLATLEEQTSYSAWVFTFTPSHAPPPGAPPGVIHYPAPEGAVPTPPAGDVPLPATPAAAAPPVP